MINSDGHSVNYRRRKSIHHTAILRTKADIDVLASHRQDLTNVHETIVQTNDAARPRTIVPSGLNTISAVKTSLQQVPRLRPPAALFTAQAAPYH